MGKKGGETSGEPRHKSSKRQKSKDSGAMSRETTSHKPTDSRAPLSEAQKSAAAAFMGQTLRKGIKTLKVEFARNPRVYNMAKCTVFSRNQKLNRYKDVGCLDHNRVRVAGANPDEYIHANYVGTFLSPKRFICAQGPMDATCGHFWMMVIQEKVESIIMLCEYEELHKPKCARYYPEEKGQEMTFQTPEHGPIILTNELQRDFKFRHETPVKIRVCTLKVAGLGSEMTVTHYHWVKWPDRGAPPPDEAPIELLEKVANKHAVPIVVHCSAGIGRTGSIVLLQAIQEKILVQACEQFEVEDLLKECRESRAALVQMGPQYYYVHEVLLNHYYRRLGSAVAGCEKNLKNFTVDYNKALAETTNNK